MPPDTQVYKYPYQPFKQPAPPVPVENEGDMCIRFDGKWYPYILAVLKTLAVEISYKSDALRSVKEANDLILRFMTIGECGMDCTDIQFSIDETGHLIYTCGNNAPLDLGKVVGDPGASGEPGLPGNTGPQGPAGPTGGQGDPGAGGRGSVFTGPELNATNPTVPDMACAVSTWITTFTHNKWGDVLDTIQAALDLGKAIADVTADVINVLLQFTVIGNEALDAAKDTVEGVVTETLDLLRAWDTEEFQEFVRCALYCELVKHGGGFGDSWDDVMAPWVAKVAAKLDTGLGPVYALFLESIALQTYQLQASVGSLSEVSCLQCVDCPDLIISYTHGSGPATAAYGDTVTFTAVAVAEPPSNGAYNVQVNFDPCVQLEYVSSTGWTDIDGVGGNVSWNITDCANVIHGTHPPSDIASFPTSDAITVGINSVTPYTITFRVLAVV